MIEPTKEIPGERQPLSQEILQQLRILYDHNRQTVPFFGGHPISVTKKDQKDIFQNPANVVGFNGQRHSPFLVCEKTDGVRYLMIVTNECQYLVSRQGNKSLVAYRTQCKIAKNWHRNPLSNNNPKWFNKVIHILDGQMIDDKQKDGSNKLKYLIFDALVVFNKKIIDQPLKIRLQQCQKVLRCNQYIIEQNPNEVISVEAIDVTLKDFFRLSCNNYATSQVMAQRKLNSQPTTVQFLQKFYIKALPHQNDGIIFNHEEKPYLLGVNNGYLKFKPAQLNTIDFLLIPNTKFQDEYKNRILDLYLGWRDEDLKDENVYRMLFYNFTIISEEDFKLLQDAYMKKYDSAYAENPDLVTQDNFGIIAQCKFDRINPGSEEALIFKDILSSNKEPYEIHEKIMRSQNQRKQLQVIKKIQGEPCTKFWKIYRVRADKNMPNDYKVATKIQQSIRDDIKYSDLIKNNAKLLDTLRI